MSEKSPQSPLNEPRLPQGKTIREILSLDPESFGVASKNAGFDSPEKFRELLTRSMARSAELKERQGSAPTSETRFEENTERVREAVKLGLSRIFFDDIERNLEQADKYAEMADDLIRRADKFVTSGKKTLGQAEYLVNRAVNFYVLAYQIRAMYEIDAYLNAGITRPKAIEKAITTLVTKNKSINLPAEDIALRHVMYGLQWQLHNHESQVRPLYEALRSKQPLSYGQQMDLQGIIADAKGAVFKGVPTSLRGGVVDAVARALREARIWKTETGDGTSGSAEYFSTGSMASSAYSHHSRPRRDMYDSSGGRDDK